MGLNADNGGGMTLIHYALMFGRTQVVILEKHGATDENSGKFVPKLAGLSGNMRDWFNI